MPNSELRHENDEIRKFVKSEIQDDEEVRNRSIVYDSLLKHVPSILDAQMTRV